MNPVESDYEFGALRLRCAVYGTGSKILLAFHGFGESVKTHMRLFNHSFLSDYKIYSIALFFHESTFPAGRIPEEVLGNDEFYELMTAFCNSQGIQKFSLFGYSFGARLCLEIIRKMPERVEKTALAAPDGIVMNWWYGFFVHTLAGRAVFKMAITHHTGLLKVTEFLYKKSLIGSKEYRLARYSLSEQNMIKKVYNTWMTYKLIRAPLAEWTAMAVNSGLVMRFFFGKFDRIIGLKAVKRLKSLPEFKDSVTMLSSGHNIQKEEIIEEIARFYA